MDVKFWKDEGSFKLRVCGILKRGDRYLVDNCDDYEFCSFPGGHVELGENTDDAVVRELREETLIDARISKVLAIEQLFFKREDGKPFHEICFYYEMVTESKTNVNDFLIEENDKGRIRKHNFKWLTIEDFDKFDVRPNAIKDVLKGNLERQLLIRYEN